MPLFARKATNQAEKKAFEKNLKLVQSINLVESQQLNADHITLGQVRAPPPGGPPSARLALTARFFSARLALAPGSRAGISPGRASALRFAASASFADAAASASLPANAPTNTERNAGKG